MFAESGSSKLYDLILEIIPVRLSVDT
jgi:hypothetical protein